MLYSSVGLRRLRVRGALAVTGASLTHSWGAGAAAGPDVLANALLIEPRARLPLCSDGLGPQEPGHHFQPLPLASQMSNFHDLIHVWRLSAELGKYLIDFENAISVRRILWRVIHKYVETEKNSPASSSAT